MMPTRESVLSTHPHEAFFKTLNDDQDLKGRWYDVGGRYN